MSFTRLGLGPWRNYLTRPIAAKAETEVIVPDEFGVGGGSFSLGGSRRKSTVGGSGGPSLIGGNAVRGGIGGSR